jgi:hypothetical protein
MVFQQTTFSRLFQVALSGQGLITSTSFGFESGGKRFFDVTIHGRPRIEQGMTVIALLDKPGGWEGRGLLGWVDCSDGSIACDSASRFFGIFLVCVFFSIMFPIRAYDVVGTPENTSLIALFVSATFGGFSLRFLYMYVKALLVKNALLDVRSIQPKGSGSLY